MNTSRSDFVANLTQELVASANNWYGAENWDSARFGPYPSSFKSSLLAKLNKLCAGRLTIVPVNTSQQQIRQLLRIQDSLEELAKFYELLADEYSKSTLVKVLAYRLMGYKKVKLPHNTTSYWSQRKALRSLVQGTSSIRIKFPDMELNHLGLQKLGYPIELYYGDAGVMATFVLKQYEYGKRKPVIKAQEGDYVIDAGGCWGDTALFFAHMVGEQGRVYAFEFTPENLGIMQRNLDLNPLLARRIDVVQRAVWERSGDVIHYSANGPGTSLRSGGQNDSHHDSLQVTTVTIDDFVREEKVPRVDFIKMDIEGAELKALKGAEETIRRFRPKLAISVYHREDDLIEIPKYLNSLELAYEFYLDHFTIYGEETILFGRPVK